MKTVQFLYNNNVNNFLYSPIKEANTIYQYICNRLYFLDENISNKIIVEACFSKFNLLSISILKRVTESTDEMIIESFMFKSYICFVFLSQPFYHCLELIWIYYHIIHFKPVNS